ncbi:hypothetical protein JB92DRAFT_2825296 [Gautieria morchelliformis]|nr:hypothetical protein JB92DRAFT_2825296 [Gautieria morchelliformis]
MTQERSETEASDDHIRLSVYESKLYATNRFVETRCTLRMMNRDYINARGYQRDKALYEELSRCVAKDCFAPLTYFDNLYGHFKDDMSLAFPPCMVNSLEGMCTVLANKLEFTFSKGLLWDLVGVNLLRRSKGKWVYGSAPVVDSEISECLSAVSAVGRSLLGTLSNNQTVDMCPGEAPGVIDHERRAQRNDADGFLCAGHTTHSTEAMRVRRVTDRCRVRVLSRDTLGSLTQTCKRVKTTRGTWTVFCLGVMCRVDEETARCLYLSSFMQDGLLSSHVTVHVYRSQKVVLLSLSSGVLLPRRPFRHVYLPGTNQLCVRRPFGTRHTGEPFEPRRHRQNVELSLLGDVIDYNSLVDEDTWHVVVAVSVPFYVAGGEPASSLQKEARALDTGCVRHLRVQLCVHLNVVLEGLVCMPSVPHVVRDAIDVVVHVTGDLDEGLQRRRVPPAGFHRSGWRNDT